MGLALHRLGVGLRLLGRAGPGVPAGRVARADREPWSSIFEAKVVEAAGAGDAAGAGFLPALRSWEDIQGGIEGGWQQRATDPGGVWVADDHRGVWIGPRDLGHDDGTG
ncbi:MAG: hypothetical protein ACFB50_19160 [Rubrobacteraceae bacterium]